jgi:hypothetical protein
VSTDDEKGPDRKRCGDGHLQAAGVAGLTFRLPARFQIPPLPPGRITLDAKWCIGNELVAYGKSADYDPAAFQGIHARYVLVIIDEAGGVPKSISTKPRADPPLQPH